MSDIYSTRKSSDGAVARPQVANAATATAGTVGNLPAALSTASVGSLITALVSSQNARGLTTLVTDKGTLQLQTSLALAAGSEVVLQLQSSGVQTRFLILSINGKPIGANAKGNSRTTESPGGGGGKAILHDGTGIASGRPSGPGVPAPISKATAITGHGSAAAGTLAAGVNSAPAMPLATAIVHGSLSPGLILAANVTAANVLDSGSLATPRQGTEQTHSFAVGNTLTLRVLGVASGGDGPLLATVPKSQVSGMELTATVAPSRTSQQADSPRAAVPTEMTLPQGRISVMISPPPQPGSRVMFELLDWGHHRHPLSSTGNTSPYLDILRLGTDWRAFKETFGSHQRLLSSDSATMRATGIAAEPGPRMASALLSFMNALKLGDLRGWIGSQNADALTRSGGESLLSRLSDDFSLLARHAADTQGTGWNMLVAPLQMGSHLDQARIYYRKHRSGSDDNDHDDETHFVVEAELTRLGLFSLEGLVRRKQFDLVVHSGRDIGVALKQGIRAIFQDALSSGEFTGSIRFDGERVSPFNPFGSGIPTGTGAPTVLA